jgi:hypothetical protein
MVPRLQLLEYVRLLGAEFARRGMRQHVSKLRVYYVALKKGLTTPGHDLEVKWTEPFVIEWLKTLRVPPFEKAYPVRPRGSPCSRCQKSREQQSAVFTDSNFPGGTKMRCRGCGTAWLEMDPG